MKGRLEKFYDNDVAPVLSKEFGYKNSMQIPTLSQVTLNIGLGEAITDKNAIDSATKDLQLISGQKPVVTKSKKSIANFNLREGMRVGMKVTLRKSRMWDFVDRLLNIALPRVRDFRGVSKNSFDGRGNYTLGITEQVIFPEIEYNQIDKIRGFQVTIGTTSINDEEARRLLELLGMPFFRSNN
ncbi:MAG: 50S ribosomal protein L5 [Dehalococcoidia bacterium]|nr:50S ribosomal protein L5 [Dehalococcoidia bacterium]